MKKALLIGGAMAAAIALILWVASWFRRDDAVAISASRPWPGGMGTLGSVFNRFPPLKANDASRKLLALARMLPKNQAVDDFVQRAIARGNLTIAAPPTLPNVSAIRDLLLREPVVWDRRVAFDDPELSTRRALLMNVARAFVASALTKARDNDPSAWDDLHAAWILGHTLDGHPQMMMQTAAMTIARMINAVAWKMPLPAPAWLGELQARDYLRSLLEAFQYQTASYWQTASRIFPTKMLADSVDRDRTIADELLKVTQCDAHARMNELGVDLTSVWRRAFRYRAEREATANALRVREGRPIETKSGCSDGAWSFEGTTLRFSREIPLNTTDAPMPLVLHVEQSRVTSDRVARRKAGGNESR